MVHSGSASPMKTSPSASPHLTVPPLRAAPGDATDQETPSKLLKTDLTSNSDSTQAPSLPPDAIITLTKALSSTSGSAAPVQTPVNGRTSGRKRTPKACDCCGPNSAGHNVATPGRNRGRGRGRGAGSNGLDTQKRKLSSQLTEIKSFDLTKEKGAEDGDDSSEEAQTTPKVAKTELRQPVATVSKQDGPMRNLSASIKDDVQKKEGFRIGWKGGNDSKDVEKPSREAPRGRGRGGRGAYSALKQEDIQKEDLLGGDDSTDVEKRLTGTTSRGAPGVRGRGRGGRGCVGASSAFNVQKKEDFTEEKGGGDDKDVEKRLTGTPGRGRGGGRGFVGASSGSKAESDSGTKKGASGGALTYKPFAIPLSMLVQGLECKKDAGKDPGGNPAKVKPAFENGETVDLSDSEPEEEAKNGSTTVSEMGNGVLSESPLDMDSVMHVDLTPDKTDSDCESLTLSNGDIILQASDHHSSMEAETSSRLVKAVPEFLGPITVSGSEHGGALRDHSLYCQTGTWEKEAGEGELRPEEDGKTPSEESRERLTDMVHEFLESFYIKYGGFISLTETDVLEHLKKKGNFDLCNKELDIKGDMSRYRAALASAPVAGFMVTHNKHTLSLEDLGTLEEQNWLNDQIINMYGELIMEATQQKVHFFNSFFHKQLVAKGYEGVKRWTKKVDLFSKSLLLIPIHLEIHWSLVTVNMATKTISYYDSQGIVFRHTTDNILKYILSEAKEKKQAAFQKSWKVNIIKGIPQQKNDSDCGVFVLEYCRCLSLKKPLTFSQDDMPRIRKRIYKELCDCRLSD